MDYISNVDDAVRIEKSEVCEGKDALTAYGKKVRNATDDKKAVSEGKQSIRDRLK